ncbi:MAG TPA: glycosyltransferase family 4 protein [Ignavibacteria bacterium]|nr:glycosyltransferase family 4 protein [Ignavibacteria bacterium]
MRVINDISKGLAEKGHSVIMYKPFVPYNSYKGEFNINSLKNFIYSLKSSFYNRRNKEHFSTGDVLIKTVFGINNVTVRDADVVIATSWPTAFSVKKLNNSKGKKFYFIQDYETWNSNIRKVNESYLLGLNAITTCNYLRNLIKDRFGVNSNLVYLGIDDKFFRNTIKVYGKVRNISFIHHGLDKKNTPAAIRILEEIKSKYPDIKVTSFGLHPYPSMPEFVKSFINPSEEKIKEIYKNSDIFLFTSKEEGFGLPPAESMASKAALVSSNVGAIPEYSENGISAMLHDPADEEGMIKSISLLINDNKLLKDISERGFISVNEKLNQAKCIKEFEKIINS